MEQTDCSETSAYKIQTPGNYPKESIQFPLCFIPSMYRSYATRVSQLKIWHILVIGIERNACRCTFSRYSVTTQFV